MMTLRDKYSQTKKPTRKERVVRVKDGIELMERGLSSLHDEIYKLSGAFFMTGNRDVGSKLSELANTVSSFKNVAHKLGIETNDLLKRKP